MKQKHIYQPFELCVSDAAHWEERVLVYHFFEIVKIVEGEGFREVNENKLTYRQGDIFLFTPLDCRGFKSTSATKFCSIRFSEIFLTQYNNAAARERILNWLKQLEKIFYQHNRFEPVIISDENDYKMVSALVDNLVYEYEHKQKYYEDNLQHLITLVLNLLSRNVIGNNLQVAANQTEEPLINKMLVHIREHIGCSEKLKIEYLSSIFNLSANYVGEYFKKLTGESLQKFITLHKMKLAEQRLIFSDATVSQIADELGFSDQSHLSKQFKNHKGISPNQFRDMNRQNLMAPVLGD